MDELMAAREQINAIDAQMADLFEQRMQAVSAVARSKRASGKPVFDAAREQQVIESNTARLQNPEFKPYYEKFLTEAMAVSRAYQRAVLALDVAAYQGVEGAWSHIALRRLFPFAKPLACATWADVCDAVEQDRAAQGVLPFENSNAGDVSAVLDLLYARPDLYVTRLFDLPIRQDLLGVPGATLAGVTTVISHQQALAQSDTFLRRYGFATKSWPNTADAARLVAQQGDPATAAIASAETAALYGLEILAKGVNEDSDNTTRFIVIGKQCPNAGQRLSLLFTVDHKPGKLAQVIQCIGEQGYNMESIKSRPLPHVRFEYYFYVQLTAPEQQPDGWNALLQSLQALCRTVRVLGRFDCE